MTSSSSKIEVRLLIDREKKRVVFAETGGDFVDLLFSFLTLPLGRIVRLLSKQSGLRSLDNLYESIEQLDAKYLETEACKEMLLNPQSAAAIQCEGLKIKGIHELMPRRFYTCSQDDCLIQSTCYYTYTSNGLCSRCGRLMDRAWEWERNISDKGGVFLIDGANFMITDDLQVGPSSFSKVLSLFEQLQIKDSSVLEEKALKLLGRSLVSNNALTEICFPDSCIQTNGDFFLPIKKEPGEAKNDVFLELILSNKNNDVLYADVRDDFVNQLVGFLTFPLGFVLKFLPGNISTFDGCIQNLYSSAERMDLHLFKSEICRNILLTPTLPTFYGIKNQILVSGEIASIGNTVFGSCRKCLWDNRCPTSTSAACVHGMGEIKDIEHSHMVRSGRFMVSDNLHISPLSLTSAIGNIGKKLPISDLVRRDVCLDKAKVLPLMSVMLISNATLTEVFCPKP